MSFHNLSFEQIYEKYQSFFLSENFHFLGVKFSIYLNRRVFVMTDQHYDDTKIRAHLETDKPGHHK